MSKRNNHADADDDAAPEQTDELQGPPIEPEAQVDVAVTTKLSPAQEQLRLHNERKAAIRAAQEAAENAGRRQAQAQRDHKY